MVSEWCSDCSMEFPEGKVVVKWCGGGVVVSRLCGVVCW